MPTKLPKRYVFIETHRNMLRMAAVVFNFAFYGLILWACFR